MCNIRELYNHNILILATYTNRSQKYKVKIVQFYSYLNTLIVTILVIIGSLNP